MKDESCQNKVILFVEDEEPVRKTISIFLERCGFDLIVTSGVSSAITAVEQSANRISAILTDVKMPDGSGVEILNHIQSLELPIPVVFLTAHASFDLAVEAIRKRAFDLLEKPPEFEQLRHLMEKACRYSELLRLEKRYTLELQEEIDRKTSEIRAQQIRLAELARELSRAEERERRRIASELHDNIGQTLIFTKMKLEEMDELPMPIHFRQDMDDAVSSIESAIIGIRTLTTEISPPLLYEVGLISALESLADSFFSRYGLKVTRTPAIEISDLDEESRTLLYQAVRELLVNVVKHSGDTAAEMAINCRNGGLTITITDNGRGFDVMEQLSKGFGLFNIKERLKRVGGSISIKSAIGSGTAVSLDIPYGQMTINS